MAKGEDVRWLFDSHDECTILYRTRKAQAMQRMVMEQSPATLGCYSLLRRSAGCRAELLSNRQLLCAKEFITYNLAIDTLAQLERLAVRATAS